MSSIWRHGACVAAIVVASCGQAAPHTQRNAVNDLSPKQRAQAILTRIGLTASAATRVEFAEYSVGMDDSARLTMVMPQADWAAIQAAPPLNAAPPGSYTAEEAMRLGEDAGDWRPQADKGVVATQLRLKSGEFLNIGTSQAAAGQVRVYLFWFQT